MMRSSHKAIRRMKVGAVCAAMAAAGLSTGLHAQTIAFKPGQPWDVADGPVDVAIIDLLGPGSRDMVTVDRLSGTFTIRLNDGLGNFDTLFGPFDVDGDGFMTDGPVALTAGDINSDDLSLLLASWNSNITSVADFNYDGALNGADLASLLANWGPASLAEVWQAAESIVDNTVFLRASAVADFDGDGDLDYAVGGSGVVVVMLNRLRMDQRSDR